ncbi:tyrosine-type recombinase/integrase (plasmid) [Micromonospora zamorensis]|uniref:tyrosine-type recombinase/integrase n=1 Tax=Micromonospora zamorensis TaxID=709883 RepID=UPI002E202BFA
MSDLARVAPPAPRPPDVAEPEVVLHGELVDPPAAPAAGPGARRLDLDRWLSTHRPRADADLDLLRELAADVARYAEASRAPDTIRKYDTGWATFGGWCNEFGFPLGPPTPVEVVALYLGQMGRDGLAVSTIDGRLAAIRDRHIEAGLLPPTDDPRLRRIRDGLRRVHGRPVDEKSPVRLPLLADMLATLPTVLPAQPTLGERRTHLAALRDYCLLTLGFAAGLRREELAGMPVDHLELVPEGLRLLVAKSKADPTGRGRRIDIPYAPDEVAWLCPVRATLVWLDTTGRRSHLHRSGRRRTGEIPLLSGLTPGARIRATALTDRHVARVVKATAHAAGQPPEVVDALAGHSLRAGLATAADEAGVPQPAIARVLGHNAGTTGRYIRRAFDGQVQRAVYDLAATLVASPTVPAWALR